jgi:flagellar hook assembly protein FlgD
VHPNPFPRSVALAYRLNRKVQVDCAIFDASGRLIRNLYAGSQSAGEQTLAWDRRDGQGRIVNAGVYFVRLSADRQTTQVKLVVLE